MNIINSKHTQFELFPNTRSKGQQKEKQPLLFKSLTLSLENIIVLCIIFIMVLVVFFSFGVERGRRIAALDKSNEKSQIINLDEKNLSVQQKDNTAVSLDNNKDSQKTTANSQVDTKDNVETFIVPVEEKIDAAEYYTIQVASFKTMKYAEKEASGLKEKGYEIFVLPKGSYSIVCVGKFAQEKEAKKFSVKLKNRYSDCLVRRL